MTPEDEKLAAQQAAKRVHVAQCDLCRLWRWDRHSGRLVRKLPLILMGQGVRFS